MWVMLPAGSISIVRRSHPDKDDERTLQVRARRSEWLETFRGYCPELGESLFADGKADYSWRAFARPEDVARAMARIVLAIDYPNFKSAAADPKRGMKNARLRGDLVSAYHKVWDALLAAGDGHSVYDYPAKGGTWATGIEACRRWGHWWPAGHETCKDCGEPNPAYPEAGPEKVYPPPAKKTRTRKPRQASAKATTTAAARQ
ncbi:MAG TPA: hypothetical protein VHZ03_15740 [Trebonia sp.]|jgi:hypothetical protein|nr:hypothetical protein [Trebonia sp.]